MENPGNTVTGLSVSRISGIQASPDPAMAAYYCRLGTACII
jgi:hypothetical protein